MTMQHATAPERSAPSETAPPALFRREVPRIGELALRPLILATDIRHVHDWVTREYAVYWQMAGFSLAQVESAYRIIEQDEHANAFLGLHDGAPAFLVESYDALHHAIAAHYPALAGDRGMHVLVGPPQRRIAGFTWQVFRTLMDFLFDDPAVRRVVVEPDARNEKIHALNRRAGFQYQGIVALPTKRAHLALCTREQYRAALAREEDRT
jgi:RimJ/RimL family protein N-acetyltransferase